MFFLYSLYGICAGFIRLKCWNEITCVLDCLLFKLTSCQCFMCYNSGITIKQAHFLSREYRSFWAWIFFYIEGFLYPHHGLHGRICILCYTMLLNIQLSEAKFCDLIICILQVRIFVSSKRKCFHMSFIIPVTE